jgi:glycosyltransferase involved in cell wall biosynthesis
MLAVIETHPVQYRAPVYRALQERLGVPVTVIYGSDFSIAGYRDVEFGAEVAWDTDLLGGYSARFLSRARPGEAAGIDRLPVAGLDAALRTVAPRAVLVVGYRPAFHRAGWRAAWQQRRPLLFRGETSDAANPRRGPAGWVRSAGLGLAYARLDACLWIGQHSRAHFERLGVAPDRLFFSPYCVDDAPFETTEAARARLRPGTRRALGLADDEWLVLYAGKLSTRKGVDLIVPAVRAWRRAGGPRRVVVGALGQGTLAAEIARQAGTAPEVPVRFIGFQNQRQLSRYYHAADLLVLPSRHSETWGLVVNEALHHGVPCVVSDRVGAAPDLVDDQTGAVFLAGQVESFTRALRRVEPLIGEPRVREACRARVRPYSVLAAAKGIAEAYHAALDRRGRGRG